LADRPCLRPLKRTAARPSSVRGPVLFCAFAAVSFDLFVSCHRIVYSPGYILAIQCNAMIVTHNRRDFAGAEEHGVVVFTPAEILGLLRENP